MENKKIENRVILTLDEYLKMRDSIYCKNESLSELINLIFNCAELNKDKTDLKLETYYLKAERVKILLKEIDYDRYQKILETLQKEEED